MMEPREIEDEGHERVLERVAAIDVAKASGMVCVRVPHESRPGRRVSRVWEVAATTGAVIELGDHLACQGIEKVTVESTSDYWRIWFYLLEAAGLDVQLVKAREARNMPGRPKTDKLDSVWQAKCTERGLLRPSPSCPRHRSASCGTTPGCAPTWSTSGPGTGPGWRSCSKTRLIKVSAVASTMTTKSVRDMIEALIAGERSPRALADLARGRMKARRAELIEALNGRFDEHHAELARMLLDQIDALSTQIDTLTSRIEELIGAMPAARGVNADGTTGPGAGTGPGAAVRPGTGPPG